VASDGSWWPKGNQGSTRRSFPVTKSVAPQTLGAACCLRGTVRACGPSCAGWPAGAARISNLLHARVTRRWRKTLHAFESLGFGVGEEGFRYWGVSNFNPGGHVELCRLPVAPDSCAIRCYYKTPGGRFYRVDLAATLSARQAEHSRDGLFARPCRAGVGAAPRIRRCFPPGLL